MAKGGSMQMAADDRIQQMRSGGMKNGRLPISYLLSTIGLGETK